jgi:hypothetical protein
MIPRTKAALAVATAAMLGLAGCNEAPPPPPPAQPLPEKLCQQAREGLDKVSSAGIFEYTADGQATIEESAWLPMAAAQRDAIGQALAFHAACSTEPPPRESTVTIRNEGGRVLTQRVVETTADISSLLEE